MNITQFDFSNCTINFWTLIDMSTAKKGFDIISMNITFSIYTFLQQ